MSEVTMKELNPPEAKRIYVFPEGQTLVLENVTKVEVRPSGKHRIETADGRKLFVSPLWLYMEVVTPEWTF